jgi:outer membrane protein OmpA-like peptidoglycan-associated protein
VDAIARTGRIATQAILFEAGSNVLLPESKPQLAEIGRALAENPRLALVIEGHTDSTGIADSNQVLSERRATAVRDYLLQNHQVTPARLSAIGFGSSKPVAANETPEGRAQNRRVELVKP